MPFLQELYTTLTPVITTTILDKINGNLDPPPPPTSPPNQGWENGTLFFALRAASSLIWDGGLLLHFILSKIAILDKTNEKPRPPPLPPKSRMGKWRVVPLRAASSLIWGGWGFAVPFYFGQDCRCTSSIPCTQYPDPEGRA